MYRKFIFNGKVAIRMCAFSDTAPAVKTMDQFAQANDPGYLITPSSTPEPYDQSALFNLWSEKPVIVEYAGDEATE